jgi:DNA modification methylase
MAIEQQEIAERYAIYQGDCIEFMPSLRDNSIHLSIYSPPFSGLYNYSSSEHDMSNCVDDEAFMAHYEFLVKELARVTMSGRCSVVHCMDVPKPGQTLSDFPGDIIRLHARHGFHYVARHAIWKEPLSVAIRTRALHLTHRQIVKDSVLCGNAGADYILVFRKKGENPAAISHPTGLSEYAGEREPPEGFLTKYANWEDPQTNKLAHWIWQQYASSIWDDIRVSRVLPYRAARDPEDEKHVHPLQLDVIERCIQLRSNPGEIVFTPFMGVGSEVYGALRAGRRGIGVELKRSYFNQAAKNVKSAVDGSVDKNAQVSLEFSGVHHDWPVEELEPA